MKKAAAALAMMSLASMAFANDDTIDIPSLMAIPFIVTSSGDLTSGYVKNWGSLGPDKGTFTTANKRIADQLQERKCAFHFTVIRDEKSGLIAPKDGVVTIACMQLGGSVVAVDVPGTFIDATGNLGLQNSGIGEKAFFLVQSGFRIPVVSE